MRFRYLWSWVLLLGVTLGGAGCVGENAFADNPLGVGGAALTGSVAGQVIANGVGVGNATVIVAGGPSATTDGNGEYRVTGLATGRYTLSLQVPSGFELAAGEQATRTAEVGGGRVAVVSWRLTPRAGA